MSERIIVQNRRALGRHCRLCGEPIRPLMADPFQVAQWRHEDAGHDHDHGPMPCRDHLCCPSCYPRPEQSMALLSAGDHDDERNAP